MTDINQKDKQLFRQAVKAMTDATPLKHDKQPPLSLRSFEWKLSDYYTEICQAESILSYAVPGFPLKRFTELKKGLIPWHGRLDLHGLTQQEAKEALIDFVADESIDYRSVLIIHGKGSKYFEPPVLKNLVSCWLKQLPAVSAFHSALPKHGGSGALYVLLKQKSDF